MELVLRIGLRSFTVGVNKSIGVYGRYAALISLWGVAILKCVVNADLDMMRVWWVMVLMMVVMLVIVMVTVPRLGWI